MAKRRGALAKHVKSNKSKKTPKRLAIKAEMLAKKAAKKPNSHRNK